jgi:hypothetical protein
MNKLTALAKKYRGEIIVGIIVFLILIFRDFFKSLTN